jgi:hypothetical protein
MKKKKEKLIILSYKEDKYHRHKKHLKTKIIKKILQKKKENNLK